MFVIGRRNPPSAQAPETTWGNQSALEDAVSICSASGAASCHARLGCSRGSRLRADNPFLDFLENISFQPLVVGSFPLSRLGLQALGIDLSRLTTRLYRTWNRSRDAMSITSTFHARL